MRDTKNGRHEPEGGVMNQPKIETTCRPDSYLGGYKCVCVCVDFPCITYVDISSTLERLKIRGYRLSVGKGIIGS